MDNETEFLSGLIELQYGQKVEEKLKKLSLNVPWAKGWPEDKKSFWNAEAFMWSRKINKEKRRIIEEELSCLSDGKNLDLGCGAFTYVKKSVGFDLSAKMLDFNDNCVEKVQGDMEGSLPFESGSFDSVTAVFVLNYVNNYQQLLSEIKRVLGKEGRFVMVLSSGQINDWQRQKEVNVFSFEKWVQVLEEKGFNVEFYENEGIWFFRCGV